MKIMEFTAYGVADEYAAITINLDNVNAIYPSVKDTNKGNTTIYYANGTWTYLLEPYVEVMEAIRKAYG